MTDLENCQHELKKAAGIINQCGVIYAAMELMEGAENTEYFFGKFGLKYEKGRLKLNVLKDKEW